MSSSGLNAACSQVQVGCTPGCGVPPDERLACPGALQAKLARRGEIKDPGAQVAVLDQAARGHVASPSPSNGRDASPRLAVCIVDDP